MKLRRRKQQPVVDVEVLTIIAELYVAFDQGSETCARVAQERMTGRPVAEVRGEALAAARRIAYISRLTMRATLSLQLLERVEESLNPITVLPALARLGYALVALAEETPEPEALLTESELEGLAEQFEIEGWLARCRELAGEGTHE